MPSNILSSIIMQGSDNFYLGISFVVPGFLGTVYNDDPWQLRIVNPEGQLTLLTVATTDFPDAAVPLAFVLIDNAATFYKAGLYNYQMVGATGNGVKSEIVEFEVVPSLPYEVHV